MIAKPHIRKNHISVPCHESRQNTHTHSDFLEIYEIFKIVCVSYATARVIQNGVFVCRHLTALCAYGCGLVQCHDRTRHSYTVGFIMHSCDDFFENVEVWEHMWSKTFFGVVVKSLRFLIYTLLAFLMLHFFR